MSKQSHSVKNLMTVPNRRVVWTTMAAGVLGCLSSSQAANYFWDENGATAGFGTAGSSTVIYSSGTSLLSADQTGTTDPAGTQTSTTLDTDFFGTAASGLGAGTIAITGTVNSSNYTFASASGAINLGGTGSISLGTATTQVYVAYNTSNTISATLIGGNSVQTLQIGNSATSAIAGTAAGNGTIILSGANTFDRSVTVNTGKVSVASLGGVGSASSNLGAPTTTATATINLIGNGTLLYTGAGESSDRVVNLSSGSGSGGIIDQSGKGALVLTGGITSTGTSSKTLILQGSTAGTGEIAGVITNNSPTTLTSISKTGSGTWVLSAANTYTGTNTVGGGVLSVANIGNVGGASSNLGAQTTAANGKINLLGGGTLAYTGTGETTNRQIDLTSGAGSNGTLDQSGSSGNLVIAGGVISSGASSKTLTLQGSTAGTGEISGVIADNSPTNIISITKAGSGTWTLSGANTYTGTTLINGGTLTAIVGSGAANNLLTNAGGVNLGNAGGKLVLDYSASTSPAGSIKAILDAGYAGGFTTGQIRSTSLTTGHTIGYGDNGTAVIARVTLAGDADLDGDVDFNDFLALQTNYNVAGTRFDQGNFNYDAATDFNDFLALQTNFGQSIGFGPVAVSAEEVAAITAFGLNPLNQAVPEPASVALLGFGAAALVGRRRRN